MMKLAGVLGLGVVAALTAAVFVSTSSADDKDKTKKPAVTIGATAPDFTLTGTDGKSVRLSEVGKDKMVVIEWFNPECPFVVKQYAKTDTMAKTRKAAKDAGAVWLTINSGAPGKQGAGKDLNIKYQTDWKIESPILLDESGDVGRLYGARTTPHMYVIAKDGKLAYMGAIDNDRSADKAGDKNHVINAINELKDGKPVTEAETRPYGCSVKYAK
jgi:peroxiredoxin